MRDLGERHATPHDIVIEEAWRILAHEDLLQLRPMSARRNPTSWLTRQAANHRTKHEAAARRMLDVQPRLTARLLADQLRADPSPSPTPAPGFDPKSGLDRVRHVRALLNKETTR